ncbi:hypothetical protein GW17_00021035 [Ensete ventricosum]|nr:hypothetical protein GW17_00021035 [Ensete ventricosum]
MVGLIQVRSMLVLSNGMPAYTAVLSAGLREGQGRGRRKKKMKEGIKRKTFYKSRFAVSVRTGISRFSRYGTVSGTGWQLLVLALEDETSPHLPAEERGNASSQRRKTRRRLVTAQEDEVLSRPCLAFQQKNKAMPRPSAGRRGATRLPA